MDKRTARISHRTCSQLLGDFSSRIRTVTSDQMEWGHWPYPFTRGRCPCCLKHKVTKFCSMAWKRCDKWICLKCFTNHMGAVWANASQGRARARNSNCELNIVHCSIYLNNLDPRHSDIYFIAYRFFLDNFNCYCSCYKKLENCFPFSFSNRCK